MYGKLFDSMYDSTLAEDWRALITFQQMIVLCDADGMIDMTPTALSRRTGIPIQYIEAGIKILENPDPYSRTPDQNGVRIELIDEHRPWGWHIVNHEKYKNLRDAETIREQTRERVRRHREKKKQENQHSGNVSNVTDVTCNASNDKKRHIDTDINTNITKKICSLFDDFWDAYPRKTNKIKSESAFNRLTKAEKQLAITDCALRFKDTEKQFIPHASTYLNGKRFNDEVIYNEQPKSDMQKHIEAIHNIGND